MGLAWPEFIPCGWWWSYCSIRSAAGLLRSSGGVSKGGGVISHLQIYHVRFESLADISDVRPILYGFVASAQNPLFTSSVKLAFIKPAPRSISVRPSLD